MTRCFMHVMSFSMGNNFKSLSRAQHNFKETWDYLSVVLPGSLPMKTLYTRPARVPRLGIGAGNGLLKEKFREETKLNEILMALSWCQTQVPRGVSHLAGIHWSLSWAVPLTLAILHRLYQQYFWSTWNSAPSSAVPAGMQIPSSSWDLSSP